MRWSQKCPCVRHSTVRSNRYWVRPACCVSFSRSVNVSSNKVNVAVVLEKETVNVCFRNVTKPSDASKTSCACLVKVFIVVALCEVGLQGDSSSIC